MVNIAFDITDANAARDAIEVLAYIAAGLDAAFPARAILAALPAAGLTVEQAVASRAH